MTFEEYERAWGEKSQWMKAEWSGLSLGAVCIKLRDLVTRSPELLGKRIRIVF